MSEVQEALEVSAALDDGIARLGPEHKAQERVHVALCNKRQMTWAKPNAELAANVLLRASLVRPARKPRRWPLAVAAGLVLAGGLSWVGYLQYAKPTVTPSLADKGGAAGKPAEAIAKAPKPKGSAPALDLTVLTRLPERSEPKIAASLEEPMLREVQAIREDTQRGFEAVMSKLPVSMDFALGGAAR